MIEGWYFIVQKKDATERYPFDAPFTTAYGWNGDYINSYVKLYLNKYRG